MDGVIQQPGRRLSLLAWGLCLVTLGLVATMSVLVLLNLATISNPDEANLIELVLSISFALLGALVASRQPANAVGWAVPQHVPGHRARRSQLAVHALRAAHIARGAVHGLDSWAGDLLSIALYPAGLAVLTFLLTPTGHLLSPRWRWVAWMGLALTVVGAILSMTATTIAEWHVPSPTAVPAISELAGGSLPNVVYVAGLGVLAVAGSSVVIRLRRAKGEERLQLRWIAAAAAFAIAINSLPIVILFFFVSQQVASVVATWTAVIGFGIALPAGFAVAMLRYRLMTWTCC